jgi:hypothetical protein
MKGRPMPHTVEISDNLFARLQKLAVPFIDTPETTISKAVDAFEAIHQSPRNDAPTRGPAQGIGVFCMNLLRETEFDSAGQCQCGLPFDVILARVWQQFPSSKTKLANLRWYVADMKKKGEELPARPLTNFKRIQEITEKRGNGPSSSEM